MRTYGRAMAHSENVMRGWRADLRSKTPVEKLAKLYRCSALKPLDRRPSFLKELFWVCQRQQGRNVQQIDAQYLLGGCLRRLHGEVPAIARGSPNLLRSAYETVSAETKSPASATAPASRTVNYEEDAIYQGGHVVARVEAPDVRWDTREIHFAEINSSDDLMLPEECEFQKFRVMIQRIGYASRIDKNAPEKGRVLRGVVAEILGYREQ